MRMRRKTIYSFFRFSTLVTAGVGKYPEWILNRFWKCCRRLQKIGPPSNIRSYLKSSGADWNRPKLCRVGVFRSHSVSGPSGGGRRHPVQWFLVRLSGSGQDSNSCCLQSTQTAIPRKKALLKGHTRKPKEETNIKKWNACWLRTSPDDFDSGWLWTTPDDSTKMQLDNRLTGLNFSFLHYSENLPALLWSNASLYWWCKNWTGK